MDRPHILAVEDDASISELLFSCLCKAGYRMSIAQSGEAALEQIEEDRPDGLILDLSLPGMNGLDVCRVMRQDPWMSRIPVLMLTGKAEENDIISGLEVGADDYMTKPFSPKILTARLAALLRRGSSHRCLPIEAKTAGQAEIAPGTLVVKSLGRCELCFDGRHLSWAEEFSPTQRQLMAILVGTAAGRASQEEVQAALWPESSPARARSSFDSLLSRLRSTLDQAFDSFNSKKYLVLKRGYLCLENSKIDAHEFCRLVLKGVQQVETGEYWPAEISFSSAFSLWQGTFVPGDFGSDSATVFQDKLEQLYIQASLTFARLLAETNRYQQAVKLLRDALRYDPANDGLFRLLYQLFIVQNNLGQANQVINQYREALARADFPEQEIDGALRDFSRERPAGGWLPGP